MARIVSKQVFKFDELSDSAKETARNWFRQFVFAESHDWEHVYSDAAEIGALIGIEINSREYKTMGGGTGSEPCIFFSGFSSQGDGASFEGNYRYAKGSVKAVKAYAPQDERLHRIAQRLSDVQRGNFYRLRASTVLRGHYMHSGCMVVEVCDSENEYRDIGDAGTEVTECLRAFADWIYRQLEQEHDYQNSDEQVDESIAANEYEFNEDGSKA